MENGKTPLAAVGQGLLAGVIGNAIFTGYQALEAKLAGGNGAQPEKPPKDWSETPEPTQVGHPPGSCPSVGATRCSSARRARSSRSCKSTRPTDAGHREHR